MLASAACTSTSSDTRWGGTVADSAGVALVSSPLEGTWEEGGAWTLTEELRIGSFGGDANYQFGQIGGIAIDSRGDIYVSDRQARDVRVYSQEGEYVRTIGAPGAGPGEFGRAISDVLISAGDTLLVPDIRNRRINRFAPDGTALESEALDLDRYRALRFRWHHASNLMIGQLRPIGTADFPESERMDAIRLIEPSGQMGDTLLTVPAGDLINGNRLRYFTPEPTWAITDSATMMYAVNSEYRIHAYDRTGVLRRITIKEHTPKPITDRDIRAFFAYLDRAWLDAGVPPSRLQANHDLISFAETFPAFSTFHVGPEGSLWVQPIRSPGDLTDAEIERYNFLEDFGASDWDVFDADGRFMGPVTMPSRFQPRVFVDDVIYGVWRDELDVQTMMKLRVRTGPAD